MTKHDNVIYINTPLKTYLNAARQKLADKTNFEIAIRSPDLWDYFQSRAIASDTVPILNLAKRWAMLMQIEHAAGTPIADIALETLDLANLERLDHTQCQIAREILVYSWAHGLELSRWCLTSESADCFPPPP